MLQLVPKGASIVFRMQVPGTQLYVCAHVHMHCHTDTELHCPIDTDMVVSSTRQAIH